MRLEGDEAADRRRRALLRTATRTRCGARASRRASICCTRTTTRSLRARSSRASTKPVTDAVAGNASTGCAMRAVCSVAVAKPAATPAKPSAMVKPNAFRRAAKAMTRLASAAPVAAQAAGYRSAVK